MCYGDIYDFYLWQSPDTANSVVCHIIIEGNSELQMELIENKDRIVFSSKFSNSLV